MASRCQGLEGVIFLHALVAREADVAARIVFLQVNFLGDEFAHPDEFLLAGRSADILQQRLTLEVEKYQ